MVDLLRRAGYVKETEDMIESMPLPACWNHGENEVGERVGRKLVDLDLHYDWFHTMLFKIYAKKGMWQSVNDLRGSMKQRNSQKFEGILCLICHILHEILGGDGTWKHNA